MSAVMVLSIPPLIATSTFPFLLMPLSPKGVLSVYKIDQSNASRKYTLDSRLAEMKAFESPAYFN